MRQSLQWVLRGSSWLALGLGSLLAGCAAESLEPGEGAALESNPGEAQQALVKEWACDGVTALPPSASRGYEFIQIKAGTDTTLRKAQPNTSFRDNARCYAQFDDPEVCLMRFPVGLESTAQIQFAQLSMRVDSAAPAKYFGYSMDKRWSEFGATWNNYTSVSAWTSPGAAQDQRSPFCTLTSTVGRVTYNLSGYAVSQIQDWISGRAENSGIGFFADASSSERRLQVYSSETEAANTPELNIWYSPEPVASQTVILSATESTTIDKKQPTKNFATRPACEVLRDEHAGAEKSCLLRWNASKIPAGSLVTRVVLTFGSPPTIFRRWDLFPVRRAWVEKQATWNEFATGSAWATSGAYGVGDASRSVGSVFPASSGIELTPTSALFTLVQSWVNDPATNLGALFGASRELGIDTPLWTLTAAPTLKVTFTPPG